MKNIIPWVLVFLLAASSYFLFSSNRAKEGELAHLREAGLEMDKLKQDNEELRKLPDQTTELEQLRKDKQELLRLRSETQKLREQVKELNGALSGANTKAASAIQTAQELQQKITEQSAPVPSPPVPVSQDGTEPAPVPTTPEQAQQFSCIANLRVLAAAKHQWALENSKGADDAPTMAELVPYLVNKSAPTCPSGGNYELNAMHSPPSCSIEGHTLTPQQ